MKQIPAGLIKAMMKLLLVCGCLFLIWTPAQALLTQSDCSEMKSLCDGSTNSCTPGDLAFCNGFPGSSEETQWEQICTQSGGSVAIFRDTLFICNPPPE